MHSTGGRDGNSRRGAGKRRFYASNRQDPTAAAHPVSAAVRLAQAAGHDPAHRQPAAAHRCDAAGRRRRGRRADHTGCRHAGDGGALPLVRSDAPGLCRRAASRYRGSLYQRLPGVAVRQDAGRPRHAAGTSRGFRLGWGAQCRAADHPHRWFAGRRAGFSQMDRACIRAAGRRRAGLPVAGHGRPVGAGPRESAPSARCSNSASGDPSPIWCWHR